MWDEIQVNKADPRPLYRQIVVGIRHLIAMRPLSQGTPLPSVRDGSRIWKVNMHTVRRAYQELSTNGIVVIKGTRGAFVGSAPTPAVDELASFLRSTADTAYGRFGLGLADLRQALAQMDNAAAGVPPVWVLECSVSLRSNLAKQLMRYWQVDAKGWPVEAAATTPPGAIVGTYFHYMEIRAALADRLGDVRFVQLRYDPVHIAQRAVPVMGGQQELLICNGDPLLTPVILTEACSDLPAGTRVGGIDEQEARRELRHAEGPPIFYTPATWDALTAVEKENPRAFPLRIVIDAPDLEELGRKAGWRDIAR